MSGQNIVVSLSEKPTLLCSIVGRLERERLGDQGGPRDRCVSRAHLDLVKRLFFLEHLDPDGDPGLVVAEAPTGLARAFSSEVAERAVVRYECIVSRHFPGAVWPPLKLPRS